MPELPEVEVLKRSLQKKIRFCKIIRVKIYNRNLRYKVPYSINRNLKNHVVNNISRISKYLIFHINFSKKLLIHLGMSGTIHLMEKNNKNNTNASFYHSLYLPQKHNHVEISFSNDIKMIYNDPRIHKNKMRVKAIGRIELLPDSIKDVLSRLDNATKDYSNHFLNIAIAYGGQNELVDAVRKIGTKIKEGKLDAKDITKDVIEENLYTSHLPQPSADMILRTSGEKRMSGFLMWQSAYSELVFLDIFWPEFRKIDLMRAIRTFQKRKRRAGK